MSIAAGWADREARIPMQNSHFMLTGSIGKSFVAALVIQMAEVGAFGLDDRMIHLLPHFRDLEKLPNGAKLTVRMLLNHTSGLPRYVFSPQIWNAMHYDPEKHWTPEERLALLYGKSALHPAGKGWSYSDTNYILLGMLLETLSGKPYYQLLREKILLPGNVQGLIPADRRHIPGLTAAYTGLQTEFMLPTKVAEPDRYAFNPQLEWTGGGLAGNPAGLVQAFTQMMSGEMLSEQVRNTLTTISVEQTDLNGEGSYGHGCMLWVLDRIVSYGHTGFMPGFLSVVEWLPGYATALALQINTDCLPDNITPNRLLLLMRRIVLRKGNLKPVIE